MATCGAAAVLLPAILSAVLPSTMAAANIDAAQPTNSSVWVQLLYEGNAQSKFDPIQIEL
eukprot:scaffold39649_cov46-Attheya_sp.AAC.1